MQLGFTDLKPKRQEAASPLEALGRKCVLLASPAASLSQVGHGWSSLSQDATSPVFSPTSRDPRDDTGPTQIAGIISPLQGPEPGHACEVSLCHVR